jgi:phospholipid N-methyltransferase
MSRFPTADKRFGQHFLHSPHVIKAITTDLPAGCDAIIEVGPGPAVLTPSLKEHGLPIYAFEMDKRFTEILTEVVGENNRSGDLVINITKTKKLTNMRATGSEEKMTIRPATKFSLEEALEYIQGDEYVEVTPKSIRLRKIYLNETDRKRYANKATVTA